MLTLVLNAVIIVIRVWIILNVNLMGVLLTTNSSPQISHASSVLIIVLHVQLQESVLTVMKVISWIQANQISVLNVLLIVSNVIVPLPANLPGVILVTNSSQQIIHASSVLIIVLHVQLQDSVVIVTNVISLILANQISVLNAPTIVSNVIVLLNANQMDVILAITLSLEQKPAP